MADTVRFRANFDLVRRKAPSYQAGGFGELIKKGKEFDAEWPTDSGFAAWDSMPCWVHIADAIGGYVEVTNNQGYERAKRLA